MDKNIQNVIKLQACKRAEYWYNRVIQEYCKLDLSKTGDFRIKDATDKYADALISLIDLGVGGVLINGIFRKLI